MHHLKDLRWALPSIGRARAARATLQPPALSTAAAAFASCRALPCRTAAPFSLLSSWWTFLLPRAAHTIHYSALHRAIVAVPTMGDSITEGTVSSLTKKTGDTVAVDEVIAVIDTDKISVDIRASSAGVLSAYRAAVGETVKVGVPLAEITPGSGPTKGPAPSPAPAAPAKPSSSPPPPPPPPPAPRPPATATTPSSSDHSHHASIQFRYGKVQRPHHVEPRAPSGSVSMATDPVAELPMRLRRRPLSDLEIQVIELGGAWPDPPKESKDKKRK